MARHKKHLVLLFSFFPIALDPAKFIKQQQTNCRFRIFLLLSFVAQWNILFSCPAGQSKYGSSCRDVDECAWRPCRRYGSTCVNYQDERGYECICPLGYMGKHCDLEVITSATITTSTDFIIAIIACLATLLRMCLLTSLHLFILTNAIYSRLSIWPVSLSLFSIGKVRPWLCAQRSHRLGGILSFFFYTCPFSLSSQKFLLFLY